VDPWDDLPAVIDLIELGFRDELDPQGFKMISVMRNMARRHFWTRLFWETPTGPAGFVWIEKGRLIGNLSLRRAQTRHISGWMIGNVVVHPDFRGRGIGRALMNAALATVEEQNGRWVGLEVRADNEPARHLYESLHFAKVGQTDHWVRPAQLPWPNLADWPSPAPADSWKAARSDQMRIWLNLADAVYGFQQVEILEVRPQAYSFGEFERTLDLWLQGEREAAWLWGKDTPRLGVVVRTDVRYHFYTWELFVHPQSGEFGVQMAVARALQAMHRRPTWPVITIVPPDPYLRQCLEKLGFQHHRSLIQMQRNMD
jgi:GNAT superfamily N-acetyltransferase